MPVGARHDQDVLRADRRVVVDEVPGAGEDAGLLGLPAGVLFLQTLGEVSRPYTDVVAAPPGIRLVSELGMMKPTALLTQGTEA